MILKTFNKLELLDYIQSEDYFNAQNIAISRHRAESHINNPRAYEKDVLMIMALKDEEMVGYLGVVPDDILSHHGDTTHCGWMSCLWVSPHHRGQKIAQQLMLKCFEVWNNQILLTEFTEAAGMLYIKSQLFESPLIKEGVRWYVDLNLQYILPPKRKIFQNLKGLLTLIDLCGNLCLKAVKLLDQKIHYHYDFTILEALNEDCINFIHLNNKKELFKRNNQEHQWAMDYPWIKSDKDAKEDAQRYAFSSWASQFIHKILIVKSKFSDEITGVLIFTVRDGHLKLPYIYLSQNEIAFTESLQYLKVKYKIKMITSFHPLAIKVRNNLPCIYSKKVSRPYLFSKSLHQQVQPQKETIQEGDGDCVFT